MFDLVVALDSNIQLVMREYWFRQIHAHVEDSPPLSFVNHHGKIELNRKLLYQFAYSQFSYPSTKIICILESSKQNLGSKEQLFLHCSRKVKLTKVYGRLFN
jgi:hypothetical protein